MRGNSYSVISTVLAGAFVAAALLSAAPVKAQTELLINNYLPPKHPFQIGIVAPWIKDVIKATNGAVKPKLSAARVGPPPKNWQVVTKGLADVVLLANLFQPRRIQLPNIAQLPLNSPSAQKTSIALWKTHQKYFYKANEYKGAKMVGTFVGSPNIIHSSNKPIRSVADLKGYKLRAAPGITTKILKSAGAVPVASGPSKIFGLVSKGVVDGIAVPGYGLRAFRVLPYIKYSTVIPGGLTNTAFSLLINRKKWDSLTRTQQDQVMTVSGMVISKNTIKVDQMSAGSLKALQKRGGEVINASPAFVADIRKLAAGAQAKWLKVANGKGLDGKAVMAYYKSQLK
jgi:TRAP-type C4-dicarboxylate transport system substrate-binding protein